MIQQSYYKNLSSRNVLNDTSEKNITSDDFSYLSDVSLESAIINSNLSNSTAIK